MDHLADHLQRRGYEPGAIFASACVENVHPIAALAGKSQFESQHLAEAIQYRPKLGLFFS